MKVSDYLTECLINAGVTDVFGIPGGVILKLMYSLKSHEPQITPHLCCHEQAAGFAACGYAHAGGRLGAAYATRGPGIANMFTCIAEAYQESLPVIFITAHGKRESSGARFANNQELNIAECVSGITKYAANIDSLDQVEQCTSAAIRAAVTGRPGPVLLDFSSSLWDRETEPCVPAENCARPVTAPDGMIRTICERIEAAQRPIFLIGDGLRRSVGRDRLIALAERTGIPFLSSRGSQDLMSGSDHYFGYVGSHGTRYSSYILSKCDLIISVGNRLAFPVDSPSFRPVFERAQLIRIDIDSGEFSRDIPGSMTFECDGAAFVDGMLKQEFRRDGADWLGVCRLLKDKLCGFDCPPVVMGLEGFIRIQPDNTLYVCDVGNNEFWFSRALEASGRRAEMLCSKSFGTLGSAVARAIGAHYATGGRVVCVCGDQGFQYNSQELHYISANRLPITVVVVNNESSGMISDHERSLFGDRLLHVNKDNGYTPVDHRAVAAAYGIEYVLDEPQASVGVSPLIYEIRRGAESVLTPTLPRANRCQDMFPPVGTKLGEQLDAE